MSRTPTTRRGHLAQSAGPAGFRYPRTVPRPDAPVTFADLGITDPEHQDRLRAKIDRERNREAALGRARWLAAGLQRISVESERTRRRNAERRAQLERIRASNARWRASRTAEAEADERDRLRTRQRELDRSVALLDSLRR